jgi:hypothetical protein
VTVPRKAWLDTLASTLGDDTLVVAGLGANARYLPHLPIRAPHFALCDAMGAAIPSRSGWPSPVRIVTSSRRKATGPC